MTSPSSPTRGDFVRFAGRSSATGAVLQHLMLTRHLLVVGASLADDNVLRLIHEVTELRAGRTSRRIGTVLTLEPQLLVSELHERQFDFVAVAARDAGTPEQSRALEIELDQIGMYACGDADYLLDPSFVGMLNDREQEVADRARQLAAALDAVGADRKVDGWRLLRKELTRFGAAAPRGHGHGHVHAGGPGN